MSDVERIIAEALRNLPDAEPGDRRDASEVVTEAALASLRAAGYEVVKPGWEYRTESLAPGGLHIVSHPTDSYDEAYENMLGDINGKSVSRRRKAGEWEPVEGGV